MNWIFYLIGLIGIIVFIVIILKNRDNEYSKDERVSFGRRFIENIKKCCRK